MVQWTRVSDDAVYLSVSSWVVSDLPREIIRGSHPSLSNSIDSGGPVETLLTPVPPGRSISVDNTHEPSVPKTGGGTKTNYPCCLRTKFPRTPTLGYSDFVDGVEDRFYRVSLYNRYEVLFDRHSPRGSSSWCPLGRSSPNTVCLTLGERE